MNIEINEVRKSLIARYSLALFVVALLATTAFAVLVSALKSSEDTAYIVNLAGKQRALSQAIVLDVHRLHQIRLKTHEDDSTENTQKLNATFKHLQGLVNEMSSANHQLSKGQLVGKAPVTLSSELQNLYFGPKNLALEVEDFLVLAREMLASQDLTQSQNLLNLMDGLASPLLVLLDSAVKQYQIEGEKKLAFIAKLETFVWGGTLITLLFEVIFIFQPLVRRLVDLDVQNATNRLELEHLVEVRTLKLEKANEKLANLAYHDSLTGLHNRLNLEQDLENIVEQFHRHKSPFSVFMLDIDWFKKVNDQHGHDAGDFVLKEFANLLTTSVRQNDVVYRAGGEEFVILFERMSLAEAIKKAEDIRALVEHHEFKYQDENIKKTVSIGVFHSDLSAVIKVKEVFKLVDEALYLSKALGRNRVSLVERNQIAHDAQIPKEFVSIVFNEASFSEFDKNPTSQGGPCIVPKVVTDNIQKLFGVPADVFLTAETCLRSFIHPDDYDFVDELGRMGSDLENYQQSYVEKTLVNSTTLRVVDVHNKITLVYVDIYFEPGVSSYQEAKLELKIYTSQDMHSQIEDALMVYNFHSMLENSNDYIYFKDRYHVFTAASKTLVDVTNVDNRMDLVGKTDYEVFPKEYADKYFKLEKQIFSGEVAVAQEFQPTLDKAGNHGWVDNRKYPIKDEKGGVIGLFGIARIISNTDYEGIIRKEKLK
ncbi:diguanylate cyclase [Thiosulfativibrio zosterae]|uniref:diguanylate cyclase n=1 Tax=Thiosulfativibrio zosterae TaxID=2675053 RepID=A0A6F8PM70_9GAMM|nr:diguanylate cyclase [Thiosulfativibrio zosterae]BBP43186.1 hypothetical protein THMIRHAT_09320 [Thiosulfativibrio zosterae]